MGKECPAPAPVQSRQCKPCVSTPTPSNSQVAVGLPDEVANGLLQPEVWHDSGQRVQSFEPRFDQSLDLSALPPGIYLVRVTAAQSIYVGQVVLE